MAELQPIGEDHWDHRALDHDGSRFTAKGSPAKEVIQEGITARERDPLTIYTADLTMYFLCS